MSSSGAAHDRSIMGDIDDSGVMAARALRSEERPYPALDADTPLVIEARRGAHLGSLQDLLSRSSDAIIKLIYRHGAVLLRGFPITSTHDFEETLYSIRALRAMHGYFMAEFGRGLVSGSTRVFHTNSIAKSGGTFDLGKFHCENYFSSDIPSFIAFCCLEAPWMGGETGTIHMANAYQELDDRLKAKLEGEPSFARSYPLADVADLYGLDEATVEQVCREVGLSIAPVDGKKHVHLYKPNVLVHPVTGVPSLHLNVASGIRGFEAHLRKSLISPYTGPQWALHRLAWRNPALEYTFEGLYQFGRLLHRPKELAELLAEYVVKPYWARQREAKKPKDTAPPPHHVSRLLDDDDVRSLAETMGRHTNVVTWRPGDVLILDNLQMFHAGMPGFGPRRLAVALANPVPIRWPVSSGIVKIGIDEGYESVFERLKAQAGRQPPVTSREAAPGWAA
jgi:alpha-ketoglutarate-dependent taurine dioxygenase